MQPRFAGRVLVVACAVVTAFASVTPASGTPIDDKRAEAQRLQQQIDANGERISALAERYHGAQLAYEQATVGIADARRRYATAQASVRRLQSTVAARAARLYKGAASGTPLSAVDVETVNDLGTRAKYTEAASEVDDGAIARLRDAQDELEAQRRNLEAQQAEARAQRDAADAAKREAQQADTEQRNLLAQVKGQLAVLVRQEQERQAEAARRAALERINAARAAEAARTAQAARASRSPRSSAPAAVSPRRVGGDTSLPTPSGRVAAVIAYARAQLGKPYRFNTAGPDTFDCSGLTMMAWRQAGVSMAHYSGAQYSAFPKVPLGALQPGDLVFRGPGGRDHVAIYVGGGMQIAATHTGDYVRLQPLMRNPSGAVRPG